MPEDDGLISTPSLILILASVFGIWGFIDHKGSEKNIERNMQEGFTAPSKIEVLAKDLDNDGKFETILEAEDKSYLLRKINGEYTLSPYNVAPSEIKYEE